MLINSPKVRKRVFRNLNDRVKHEMANKSPLVQGIKRYFIFEGDKLGVVRSDGTRTLNEIKKYEASMEVKKEEIRSDSISRVIDGLSTQLADAQSKAVLETLKDAVESVGNTVDGKGAPASPNLMIEVLEKIQIDFDGDQPNLPSIVCSPASMGKFKIIIEKMMTEEPYKSKYESVIAKKKQEFNEREASRKLVD